MAERLPTGNELKKALEDLGISTRGLPVDALGQPMEAGMQQRLSEALRDERQQLMLASLQAPANSRCAELETRGPSDFTFLKSTLLRRIAERDWDECQRAFASKCWKSVLILAGGIVETILLALIRQRRARAMKTKAAAGGDNDLTRWTLDRLIKVAAEMKLVPPAVETLPNPLRQYRNLAHPGNEVREKLEFGEPDAATAFSAVRSILARFSKATYVEGHATAEPADTSRTQPSVETREVQDK
jgi:hypothetical protein